MRDRYLFYSLMLALAPLASACGMKFHVSPSYGAAIQKLPFRAPRPLARELRYTYVQNVVNEGDPGKPLVASDPTTREQLSNGMSLPEVSRGTKWSEIYEQKAAEARTKGDNDKAALYSGLSSSTLQTEQATYRMVSGAMTVFAIYNSAMAALAGAAQAFVDSEGEAMRDWVLANSGVIGESAPPGSVLSIHFFTVFNAVGSLESDADFTAIVVLNDGHGRTLESAGAWTQYARREEPKHAVPEDAQPVQPDTIVPPQHRALFEPLSSKPYAAKMLFAANAALADLSARIDALDAPPP